MEQKYDVFLSHNSQDKESVKAIGEALIGLGMKVWLDEWELQPGLNWQEGLERGIKESRSTAVFVGGSGIGPWEDEEAQAALTWAQNKKLAVIPVGLPDMPATAELPVFLANRTWVKFKSLDDPTALERLQWGITGKRPQRRARRLRRSTTETREADPVADAVANLDRTLRSRSVTYFVGKGAFCGDEDLPPGNAAIAAELLQRLSIEEPNLAAPVDLAGTWYSILSGDRLLEDEVANLIVDRSRMVPTMHRTLAGLLQLLARQAPARTARSSHQLIVTSNFDVLLERALVSAAIPFTRLVQRRTEPRVQQAIYEGMRLLGDGKIDLPDQGPVALDDIDTIDEWISQRESKLMVSKTVSFTALTQPIVYKCHGSNDVSDSCVLSTRHYMELLKASTRSDFMPRSVQKTIGCTPSLFLGCCPLDSDFLLMYHGLLKEPFEVGTEKRLRYAPLLPPKDGDFYRRIEARIWDSIETFILQQMGILILKQDANGFLAQLTDAVRARVGDGN